MTLNSYLQYLTKWIRARVTAARAQGVVMGLSGGIDSAVVALLCQRSFPRHHLVLTLPCASPPGVTTRARLLVQKFSLNWCHVDLTAAYQQLLAVVEPEGIDAKESAVRLARANLKARLRMSTLYYHANRLSYLVVGTDNWPEWYSGYFTKHGDGAADMAPIIHLLKRDVRQAAALLGVPTAIVAAAPSADLWPGQTDEQELGVSYEQLDQFLGGQPQPLATEQTIMHLYRHTKHKRHGCYVPELPFHNPSGS